ncbi:type VI secretion system baseplate subunit TssE [Sphaerotilus microaerophilus]|jgi:type VI secretion system protein ImpF|nr:type VI secretion system baseplate subunit TssE [Sphaerotilus sp. FB-5]
MATAEPRERLQPALLDRLRDDTRRQDALRQWRAPSRWGQAALDRLASVIPTPPLAPPLGAAAAAEPGTGPITPATPAAPAAAAAPVGIDDHRVMTKAELREAVLRDLAWLFNAVQSLLPAEVQRTPALGDSVLNYGLPALSGQLASRIDVPWLERAMRQAILRFEPRIIAATLSVRAIEFSSVLDTHNVIEFEIRGELWAQPIPLELLLRTQVDLEAGQVVVRDSGAAAAGSLR